MNGICRPNCSKNNCAENEFCKDTDSGYDCLCEDGFERKSNGICLPNCSDNDCGENEYCKDTESGFDCLCEDGFDRKSNDSCLPDCSKNDCDKNAVCSETELGYDCQCSEGFDGDGKNCNPYDTVLVLGNRWEPWFSNEGELTQQRLVVSAFLIDSTGDPSVSCFESDDDWYNDVRSSCSVNWANQMFIFGGQGVADVGGFWRTSFINSPPGISRLDGYRLNRVGNLAFDFFYGACSVMKEKIYLCFDDQSEG